MMENTNNYSVFELIVSLEKMKNRFESDVIALKKQLLKQLSEVNIMKSALLKKYHDILCFIKAYPDDAEILFMADAELNKISERVELLKKNKSNQAESLNETGIVNTYNYCPLSFAAAEYLMKLHPENVSIDWEDDAEEKLLPLLPFTIPLSKEEYLVEIGCSAEEWLKSAGLTKDNEVSLLLNALKKNVSNSELRSAVYDREQIRIKWKISGNASRTLADVKQYPVYYHDTPLLRTKGSLSELLPGDKIPVSKVPVNKAEKLLNAAFLAVLVRYREVYGFNYANINDVRIAGIGRGTYIACFGLKPEFRLPIRSHFGYLLIKNNIPVGYGDFSVFLNNCDIAFNIYEEFRAGEPAFIFIRFLDFLYQHFNVRTFNLDRFQIGFHNEEAIKSGAYWFYDKLGFRLVDKDAAQLADDERNMILSVKGYRTPAKTLRKFAKSCISVSLHSRKTEENKRFSIKDFCFNLQKNYSSQKHCSELQKSLKGIKLNKIEQRALIGLQPFLSFCFERKIINNKQVLSIIKAKSSDSEYNYVKRCQALIIP